MNKIFQTCILRHIALSSLPIALVVGTLLNLINQGGDLLHGDKISWFHLVMNYLVPYCVASYSAAKNELEQRALHDQHTNC